jgi:predicted RNase H-like nuclease (RuvC/YqgF family)
MHAMANLENLRLENEDLKSTVEILTKDKQEKEKEVHQLRQDLNKETSKSEKLQKRLNKLERECAQEQVISKQLNQNQIDLKCDLEIKTKVRIFFAKKIVLVFTTSFFIEEIEELREQMRDLMLHIGGEEKLKELNIPDELQTSAIVVGAPSHKVRRKKRK